MRVNDFPYIAGEGQGPVFPLRNFLPPLPNHVFKAWISENQLEHHYLIDPISANPLLPITLAANGYKVISSRSNPINWLITEVLSDKDCQTKINRVVNKLLIRRKDGKSVEEIMENMYRTPCSACSKRIQPQGFVWEKGAAMPTSRVYACPHCGDSGEREISDEDRDNLTQLGNLDIHIARAIQKVNPINRNENASMRDALDCYLPRALYACMLLVNRSQLLALDKTARQFLRAALLVVFNDAHALHHWPDRDYRFLQLSVPQRFFEKNLFLSLTTAHLQFPQCDQTIPITYWPYLPGESGGVCFFHSRLAEQKDIFSGIEPCTAVTVFPRPGRAYWTLSAIWAGWLWGKNAVQPIRSALRRRRYDWAWYAKAIFQSIRRLQPSSADATRVFALFPGFTPNLVFGLFTGMRCAGFDLQGAAFREKENALQAEWKTGSQLEMAGSDNFNLDHVIQHALTGLNKPLLFQDILLFTIIQLALNRELADNITNIEDTAYSRYNNLINQQIERAAYISTAEKGTPSTTIYFNRISPSEAEPLAEQIETVIFQLLDHSWEIPMQSIDRLVCKRFPGNRTPSKELITMIVNAYGKQVKEKEDVFQRRENEGLRKRQEDLKAISELLLDLGRDLGYQVMQGPPIIWKDPQPESTSHQFYLTNTMRISETVFQTAAIEKTSRYLVYPASRAGLLYFRLGQDPQLVNAIEDGWHLVKFRHVRRIAEKQSLTRAFWTDMVDKDPPLREAPAQLLMI